MSCSFKKPTDAKVLAGEIKKDHRFLMVQLMSVESYFNNSVLIENFLFVRSLP